MGGRRQAAGCKPWLQGKIRLRLPCAYSSQQMRHSCERHRRGFRVLQPLTAWRRKPAGRGRRGPHLNLATADVLHDRETLDSHRYGVVRHSLKCARDGLFSPAAAPPSTKVEEQRDEAQDSRGDNQWNGVLDAATCVFGAHGALLVAVVAQGGRRRRRNWRSWADH